jgi:N-acetylglutamate synthase/N-acetylornithine aminotransferase
LKADAQRVLNDKVLKDEDGATKMIEVLDASCRTFRESTNYANLF